MEEQKTTLITDEKDSINDIVKATISPEAHTKPQINKSSYIMDLFAVAGVLIMSMIATSIIMVILAKTASTSPGFILFFSYSLPFFITIIFSIWLFMHRGYKGIWPKLSINSHNIPFILYGCLLALLGSVVLEPVLDIFPKEWLTNMTEYIGTGGWSILTTIVMAPLLEEILFRGVIQGSSMSRYGTMRSILISSALFGIIHIIPQQVIYAFFIGLILGYIYWKTQSILSVILIHAFNNGVAYIQKDLFGDDISELTIRELIKNDTLYWIAYSIITVLFITALILLLQQTSKADRLKEAKNIL